MAIKEMLEEMDAALDDGDIATARELLGEVRTEFRTRNAWNWLRTNQPKSYEQLIEELEQALNRANLRASGQTKLRQLVDVFRWCEEHGIELADITYIPSQEGWLYLAAILDLYARRIVGWAMSARMTVVKGPQHSCQYEWRWNLVR